MVFSVKGPVLITGGTGQLALALEAEALTARMPFVRAGRPAFDFDRPDSIEAAYAAAAPSAVVNAAAYTAVDAAEGDSEAAFRANRDGPAMLARLCARDRVPLIHVSTDYVFDGRKGAPYSEDDVTNPQGVYGASKLAGEHEVLSAWPDAVVLRTSWVYSPTGRNFVRTMLGAARKTDHLRVVADQRGCPTTAADLAETILGVLARMGLSKSADGTPADHGGVYHAAGTGWTTWHGFAEAVFEEASRHGHPVPTVDAIATADWPTPAARPADSRLHCGKLAARFGLALPPWRDSLARTIDTIFAV